MPPDFSDTSLILEARTELLEANVAEEAVLLDPEAGVYYGVNSVGATVWEVLQEPASIGELRDAVVEEYGISREACERDLAVFLEELAAQDLIEVHDDATA